jgi:hypothetical protein
VFAPNGQPISEDFEIEVGFMPNNAKCDLRQSVFYEQAMEIESMNITTFENCLSALEKFGGNHEQAIDYLLNQL